MSAAPVIGPMRRIKEAVAARYEVSVLDLDSDRRLPEIVEPRHVAIYLCRVLTPASLPAIGRAFGDRDHTTVRHAVRRIERLAGRDPALALRMEEIASEITATLSTGPGSVPTAEDAAGDALEACFQARIDAVFAVLERLERLMTDLDRRSRTEAE